MRRLHRLSFVTIALILCLSSPLQVSTATLGISVAQAQAQTTQERNAEAVRLYQLSVQQYNLGQFREALKTLQQVLVIVREIAERKGEGLTLYKIGSVYDNLGQYPKALEFYNHALAITKQIGDKAVEGLTFNGIGLVYHKLGQYSKALEFYTQALAIYKQISNKAEEGTTLNNIGGVYDSLSQYPKALEFFEQALTIRKQIGDKAGEGTTLNNIGAVYDNLNQYPKALEFFEQALAICQQIGDKAGEGTTLNNIGAVYDDLGQYPKALKFYHQALTIREQIGDKPGEDTTLNNIGLVYHKLGQHPKALEFHQQARAIAKEIGDKAREGLAFNNIGGVYDNLGQYLKALEFYTHALAIAKETGDKAGENRSLNNIGLAYHKLGQYPKALEFYTHALAIAKEIDNKAGKGLTLSNMGAVYNVLRKYPDAEKTLLASIEVWESLRSGLKDDQKISIFETQASSYVFLQQALVAQNKNNMALEIAERGRARAFVELLASKLSPNSNNQPNITQPKIQELKQIASEQKATLVEYSIIYDFFKIQGKQQGRESKLYIWVIKPTGEVNFRTADLTPLWQKENSSLKDLVTSSRESIGVGGRGIISVKVNPQSHKKGLQQLHELLISPIAELLPSDPSHRVIFVPQGELFLVPFGALQDKGDKYLIEKHTILTAPAVQVLDLTQKQQNSMPTSSSEVLIAGNPTMPKVSIPIGSPPQQLSPLPNAEKEANEIARLFNTKAIIGKDATKATILQQIPKAKLIHLATHGLLDDLKNLGVPGAVALAPSGQDDGLLTAGEILDLKLNVAVVVLSACDTGRGNITSDGVIGLSRSLISAGATSVLVSLWSVPDAPTSQLMTEFYRHLQLDPDKAKALRQAMLNTMKQHPNPRDWAAFTLIGEAD